MEILIADDDPVVRHLLGSILKANGHTVELKESGEAAIAYLREKVAAGALPNVVLLDLQLLDMSGSEVLTTVRSFEGAEDLPILILSANKETEVLQLHPELAAANGFLEKPFPPDVVLSAIAAVATG